MTTVLVPGEGFEGESVALEGDAFRHLFRAARLAVGDRLRIVDGHGRARHGEVAAVSRRRAEIRLGEAAPSHEPATSVEVFVAPPKSGRASWMVEKLTEVGVKAIHLWATSRGPRRYGPAQLERLNRVAVAALEQSGRSYLPQIDLVSWEEGLERLETLDRRWLLTPGAPLSGESPVEVPTAILIGPEGGWSPEEQALLTELPCLPVGLGPTLLRIETAAVVSAARALLG